MDKDKYLQRFEELFAAATRTLLPKGKFGILFSGGIDSTTVALMSKKFGTKPVLYTSTIDVPGFETKDCIAAIKVAKELGLELKIKRIKLTNVENYLKKVIPIIKTTDVVQVGVALAIYASTALAKEDGIRIMLSGAGSDEIFAGYKRFEKSTDLFEDSKAALHKLMLTDLKRDENIAKANAIELRTPFLNEKIIEFALSLPYELKLSQGQTKVIVRRLASKFGLSEDTVSRKKCAAQYGSGFDYALKKLAKSKGFRNKSRYLYSFYNKPNLKLAALFSSGKDSTYAMHIVANQNYSIECLISLISENPDSYMFHTPNINFVELQAKAMDIPLLIKKTKGEKEAELKDLEDAILEAKEKYKVEGIVNGAIHSTYQRNRIQRICEKLNLRVFSPLWRKEQQNSMRETIQAGIEFIIVKVAAQGLDRNWLGRVITQEDVDMLVELDKKTGFNVAGEGGEFETFVIDCPLFKKRIEITDSKILEESENTASLIIKKAELAEK